MKKILLVGVLALVCIGCSTKERAENKHMMSDELEDIQKAKDAVKLVDSVNTNITNMTDSLMKQSAPADSGQ